MVVVESGPAARESSSGHILLLHDHPAALDEVSATLRDGGFRVSATDSPADALGLSISRRPHLILIGLKRAADVADVCRRFRSLTDAPLYILAECMPPPGIIAPPAGVNGTHLLPPYDQSNLHATLHAALHQMRTTRSLPPDDLLLIGDLEISLSSQTVVRQGRPLDLSPIEFRLLAVLTRQMDRAVSSRRLLTEVWGPDYAEDVQNLRIFIRYLRAKIEDDPNDPCYLLTESNAGYRLTNPRRLRT